MKFCTKEARRLKSKVEFTRLMEKMKKRFWTSWRNTKSTNIKGSGGGFGRGICKVGKGAQVENLLLYWSLCASVDVGRFLYLNKYATSLGSTNLSEGFFGLIFPTKRIFRANSFVAQKSSEMSPLSGSTPVFVSQTLAAQTF